jgi:hypothetical protein
MAGMISGSPTGNGEARRRSPTFSDTRFAEHGWYINGEPQDARAIPASAIYPVEQHPPVPNGAGGKRLYPL